MDKEKTFLEEEEKDQNPEDITEQENNITVDYEEYDEEESEDE